jgi:hypothetical protein
VKFAAMTLCVASQRVFIVVSVYFVIDSVRKMLVKVKGKIVPVLPLTRHHAMKAYWGVEVQLHPLFDLAH